ncbi:hypothetical protein IEO_03663 [Bacillus wiedmannii]|nr:hypothetical protein IEO_03663 [Bacillus wiedmannii]
MALFFVFLIGMGISFAVHDTSSTDCIEEKIWRL